MGVILFLNLERADPGPLHARGGDGRVAVARPAARRADRGLVTALAYAFLLAVALPVLVGGKVYNMLQAVMTVKVAVVLGFCLIVGRAASSARRTGGTSSAAS